MKKRIIITSKFNIMTDNIDVSYKTNAESRKTFDWIERRIDIFMTSTLQSLISQTNQDFTAIYAYDDSTENYIFEALDMYDSLPDNIEFIPLSKYKERIDSLSTGYDLLYLSRLDSDDLYCNDFVEKLHTFGIKDDTEELLCQYGYLYDKTTNKLAEYYNKSFTFYTFIYKLYKEKRLYSSLNIDPYDLLINFSHLKAIDYNYELIPGRNFIFSIHADNTDKEFHKLNNKFTRVDRIITDGIETLNILMKFF